MRSFIKSLVIVLLSACSILSLSSCKDKCGTTTCQNGGTCSDNACLCLAGFTGTSCQTASSGVAVGTYNCSRDNCVPAVSGVNAWKSAVTAIANNGYQVNISNFDNANITVVATIDSNYNISIVPVAGTYGVSATGKYANDTIRLQFTTSSAVGGGYKCNMIMAKIK